MIPEKCVYPFLKCCFQDDVVIALFNITVFSISYSFCVFAVCTHQVFNMAFLIDGSASIKNLGAPSAAKYKDLVKTVVDFYHVSPVGTNVATVVFSSNATTIFKLDTYYSKSDINATIDAIVFPGKATRIGNGLTVVRNEVFANARSGIPNIFILITDGVSIDDIVLPSTFLKAMKVVMFAVGVGEFYAKEQLEEISSDPDVTYVFESDTADLPELATQLKNAVCAGRVQLCLLLIRNHSHPINI